MERAGEGGDEGGGEKIHTHNATRILYYILLNKIRNAILTEKQNFLKTRIVYFGRKALAFATLISSPSLKNQITSY